MEIQKVFSNIEDPEETLYSVLMSGDELALFSKMEDEDYIEDQNNRKKSVKHAKAKGALLGGTLGASVGGRIGAAVSKNALKGGLIGAGIGAASAGYAGYKLGKAHKKATEKDADREINKYQNASEADKKYLRKRREDQKQRELQERQARAQEQMAWNSYRYYSDKKNEEETKYQKGKRKHLVGNLVLAGGAAGAGLGAGLTENKNKDRAIKIAENAVEDSKKVEKFLSKLSDRYRETGGRFKDQQTANTFDKAFEWGANRAKANAKGVDKAFKVARAMDNKKFLKNNVKGAAIGTAVIAPLAYAANKAIKNRNEEINKSRRNKK